MILIEVVNPANWEKISFLTALVVAVVWLWREISSLNTKRETDLKLWKDTYKEMMDRQLEMMAEQKTVIEHNTIAMEEFREVLILLKQNTKANV